jgi:hypothetical protein
VCTSGDDDATGNLACKNTKSARGNGSHRSSSASRVNASQEDKYGGGGGQEGEEVEEVEEGEEGEEGESVKTTQRCVYRVDQRALLYCISIIDAQDRCFHSVQAGEPAHHFTLQPGFCVCIAVIYC